MLSLTEGECQCTNGYFGPDCSLDKSDPLTIDDVYGDGICDLKDGSTCSCFTIQTISLLDEFVCNVTKTEVRATCYVVIFYKKQLLVPKLCLNARFLQPLERFI